MPDDAVPRDPAGDLRTRAPGIVRPRLRADHPLLWRSGGRLQVGIGDRAVRLGAVPTEAVRWITGIDGTRDWAQVAQDAARLGVTDRVATRLLTLLVGAGAIDDVGTMPDALRWRDRVLRDEVSGDLAAAGFAYGSGALANVVVERRIMTSVAIVGSGVLAHALREAAAISGLTVSDPGSAGLHLMAAAHPALIAPEVALEDRAHLPVAVFGDIGEIGPLVVPGRTSCLRCAHLHRRDADPGWPPLSLQLEQAMGRLRPGEHPTDRLLARATATAALLLARRWADDPLATDAWADQVLEVHLPDAAVSRRPAPPHALCGCHWPEQAA